MTIIVVGIGSAGMSNAALLVQNHSVTAVDLDLVRVEMVDARRSAIGTDQVFFTPEFLWDGQALYDNLYPSRIIVVEGSDRAGAFANLLIQGAEDKTVTFLFTDTDEAIKLFANTYFAMRAAFSTSSTATSRQAA